MSNFFSLLLYNLLLPLGLVILLPKALLKMRARGGRWQDMAQRFGFFTEEQRSALPGLPAGQARIWIHAVSVGEVGIAIKLITKMLQEHGELGFVMTVTTPTGHALAKDFAARLKSASVMVMFSPLDLPFVGSRFLTQIQPAQIVLVEAELWPNLVASAKGRGIRVSMINARLSANSERRFRQFGFFIKPVFAMLDLVLVQEPNDAARYVELGVAAEKIQHTGSIKFDPQGAAVDASQVLELSTVLAQAGICQNQPILLLASTHKGEEVLLSEVALSLHKTIPSLALLIAPRHVERADEIITALQALGVTAKRRSAISVGNAGTSSGLPTLLIDTTGELRAWQCLASAVVIGKSFLATGGQNPAEAVVAGKPVLFGPHMENFEALVELLLKHQGAVQVPDVVALETVLEGLLLNTTAGLAMGKKGQKALSAHEGATDKTISLLTNCKNQTPG